MWYHLPFSVISFKQVAVKLLLETAGNKAYEI